MIYSKVPTTTCGKFWLPIASASENWHFPMHPVNILIVQKNVILAMVLVKEQALKFAEETSRFYVVWQWKIYLHSPNLLEIVSTNPAQCNLGRLSHALQKNRVNAQQFYQGQLPQTLAWGLLSPKTPVQGLCPPINPLVVHPRACSDLYSMAFSH
ncbi:MAG: hypothetical protein EZS28_039930 [Streblomastix strix]|uniref:Uncharacterized protein n=1 Tax=Streblomastix strix TaxID=222440 RepID=A0A5J4U2D9_9EUKA|nr:MAG: hypothetical protein EZS28_039930 [Streblomastix strix]